MSRKTSEVAAKYRPADDAAPALGYGGEPMSMKLGFVVSFACCAALLTACKQESANSSVTAPSATNTSVSASAPAASSAATVDTTSAEREFASAEPATKNAFQSAADSVKAGNYSDAIAKLQRLAGEVRLTDAQKQAIRDLLAQLSSKGGAVLRDVAHSATNAVNAAGDAANRAVSDLKNAIGK